MKMFGRFETDSHQESEKSTQSKEDVKEDDLRRNYLNEPSAKQTRSDHEVFAKHSEPQKRTTFMDYMKDMFGFNSKEQYRLERDEEGYVKKLYSEIDDPFPKSDETTKLMTYMSDFLGAKPGDEKKGNKQKLLDKVIAHHGNEWCQELDDANNESGDSKRNEIRKSTSSESLEVDEEDDSIKLDGKLLTKSQHGSEWLQDLDERGDTNLQQREKQVETENPAKEEAAKDKGDGLQLPEVILSFLTDLLDVKLNNPQEEVKAEKERKDNLMAVAYLRKVFGMTSEKLEDPEDFNAQIKSEGPLTLGEDIEQVEVPQSKNVYDAKIRVYLNGLFKSKSESDVPHVSETPKQLPIPEETEEIVTIATNFEEEANNEVSGGIAESEKQIVSDDGDVGLRTKSFNCNKDNLHEAHTNGLINCAIDVVKIFSKRKCSPGEEELAISRAIEEEDYVESTDEFEDALDQCSDEEEHSLANPINLKPLAVEVVPSVHKRGSILRKIYNSGYKHIFPHSTEENSLLHQCRRFLSSPNITSPGFFTEPYANDSRANSMSEKAKNEDVFEDAQDFLPEKAKGGPSSSVREEVFQPGAGVKNEIRFLIRGEDCSQVIVTVKNEEDVTTIQGDSVPEDVLTISAPGILGPSKPGRIYDAIQNANLDMQGVGGGELGNAKDVLGKNEPEVEEFEAHDLGTAFESNEMNITQKMLGKN